MESTNILLVLKPFVKVLDKLSISYYISGSIASSIFGMPRSTMDIDIVANIQLNNIPHLKKQLGKDYYLDEDLIKEAIRHLSSFNLIHLETAMKIDVFIQKSGSYAESALERKQKDTLIENDASTEFYFSSPEDIVLNKLKWYEMGKRISERQWFDALGVIKIQENSIDKEYLKKWAKKLDIYDLLVAAFKDSEIQL